MTKVGLKDKLKIAVNFAASRTDNIRADAGAMVGDMIQLNPILPVYTNGKPTSLEKLAQPHCP